MVISKLLLYITSFYHNILSLFEGKRNIKILMLGLDAAGKTSLLYRLKFGENVCIIPTMGYNRETVDYKNLHMDVMDICGQVRLRPLWSQYYEPGEESAIIFVIDSCDRERIIDVKENLTVLCEHEKFKNSQLLIFANKQDKEGALTPRELTDILDLYSIQNQKWFVQPCSAINGTGIYDGFDWISSQYQNCNMRNREQNPDAVDRLDLAYRDITEINPQIVDRFGPYVKELDLSNNNLEKDLTILEGFKKLTTLVLDNNRISHHIKFPVFTQLHTLWINSNQISNLSVFVDRVCESFPNVRTFSMLKNEACPNFFNGHSLREYKDYRLYIISRLKCIQILDSTPVTPDERVEAIKLYGNFNTANQSLANSTPKPILVTPEVSIEDDPKKKRELQLKQTLEEKEQKKKEKQERRERRRLKREEKEEKTFKKLQEKQKLQQQLDTDSTITNKDDFTSDEEEDDNNNNNNNNNGNHITTPIKPNSTKNSLPVFSSEQSPAATILPPNPHKQSTYDSHEIADDEAFTAESSDHSDLPLYKNSTFSPPPPPNTLLYPPPPNQRKPQNDDEDDDDDEEEDDDQEESETESSEWSSEELDEDDEEVNQINSKLPTKMTLRDQYYQDEDDDDEEDSESEYTHFPVRPPIKK
ncbi:hypothetical protein RB653_005645 [Dictyostelium firmibasis]|uniref:Uncharacterized protein n=1 Tax=Dictyostelium firmibasis TaxID=79012 RepID=A0AAN7UBV2_9MYCE